MIKATKRGLVDGIRQLSLMLFGTALDSDVNDLHNRYTETAISTNKMVQLNCKNIERLNHNIHTFLTYTNQVWTSLSETFARLHEQYAFHKVSLLLSALETCYLYHAS